MKLFYRGKDGGPHSTVWGYWLIEWKKLFSIVLLRFEDGSRDAYHSHAFNCFSWVLRGRLDEQQLNGRFIVRLPSWRPFMTHTDTFHKVVSQGRSWVLSFRGPWIGEWREYIPSLDLELRLKDGRLVDTEGPG